MVEPVIAADGETYEKAVIEAWINGGYREAKGGSAGVGVPSPVDGSLLAHTKLTHNQVMKNFIWEWLQRQKERLGKCEGEA